MYFHPPPPPFICHHGLYRGSFTFPLAGRVCPISKCGQEDLMVAYAYLLSNNQPLRPIYTMRHVSVPSEWSVFTLSVVVSHLPEQHVTGGLRLFPPNMKRYSFSKRQLAATAFMLDEEEKNAALSDKKKHMLAFFFPDTVTVLLI